MDFKESHYYNFNRRILRVLGQWPLENECYSRFLRIFFFICICFGVLSQIPIIMNEKIQTTFYLNYFPMFVIALTSFMNFSTFLIKMNTIKELLLRIAIDWKSPHTKEEVKIKEDYALFGKTMSVNLTAYLILCWAIYLFVTACNPILNIIMPLNESRHISFPLDIFTNEEIYPFPFISLHYFLCFIFNLFVASNVSLFVVFIEHACGMLTVTSYRLQKILSSHENSDREDTYNIITLCIHRHNKALEFISILENGYRLQCLFCVVSFIMIAAVGLANVTNYLSVLYTSATLFILYVGELLGEMLIKCNLQIGKKSYDSEWYEHSVEIQKLMLLVLLISQKRRPFKIYALSFLSLEEFSKLVRAIMSYCMVVKSLE